MSDEQDSAVAEALSGVTDEAAPAAPPEAPTAPAEVPPPPAPVEEAKPALEASRALAARAAKEKAFRQEELTIKAEKIAWEAEKASITRAKELERLAKEDPLTFLEQTGHSFEKMGADLMSNKRPGPADKALEKIAALEAKLAERDAADERRQVDTMYDATKHDVSAYVTANPTKYEFIVATGAQEDVFDEVQRHYEDTGEIDVDGAAERVEAYLESMSEKLVKSPKARKFFPSDATAPTPPSKTLSNSLAASVPTRDKAPTTDEELFQAAIAQLG